MEIQQRIYGKLPTITRALTHQTIVKDKALLLYKENVTIYIVSYYDNACVYLVSPN